MGTPSTHITKLNCTYLDNYLTMVDSCFNPVTRVQILDRLFYFYVMHLRHHFFYSPYVPYTCGSTRHIKLNYRHKEKHFILTLLCPLFNTLMKPLKQQNNHNLIRRSCICVFYQFSYWKKLSLKKISKIPNTGMTTKYYAIFLNSYWIKI